MATSSTVISLLGASCRARTLLALPSTFASPRRAPGRARLVAAAATPTPEPKPRVLVVGGGVGCRVLAAMSV